MADFYGVPGRGKLREWRRPRLTGTATTGRPPIWTRRWRSSISTRSTRTRGDLLRRAGGKPVRVASKSVRCRALLERVLALDGFGGVMCFTLAESLWLARCGVRDVLLAYPSADRGGFAELAADPKLARAVTVWSTTWRSWT